MIQWDIYEITSEKHPLHGVKCRGRIRKFAVQNKIDLLVENASDADATVRFAIVSGTDPSSIVAFVRSLFEDATIERVRERVPNPVLSKLKVNILERYEI